MTARRVFENLIDKAKQRLIGGNPDGAALERAIRRGNPIPKKCLPGQLLQDLSVDELELLSQLTSDDARHYGWHF